MELIEPRWLATKAVTERNLGNAGPKASFAAVDLPLKIR